MTDPIRPSHYRKAGVECVDVERDMVLVEEFIAHCRLSAFEYLWRAGEKGPLVEDLRKAREWLGWAIDALMRAETEPLGSPIDPKNADSCRPRFEDAAKWFSEVPVAPLTPPHDGESAATVAARNAEIERARLRKAFAKESDERMARFHAAQAKDPK